MRLIDADEMEELFNAQIALGATDLFAAFEDALQDAQTVDAVPVVWCKDCCHSYDDIGGLTCSYGPCVDCIVPDDFSCKHGERKC